MKKKIFSFDTVFVLLIALFFAVTAGGCGGGSNSSLSSSGGSSNAPQVVVNEEDSAVRPVTTLSLDLSNTASVLSMDDNGDGIPYFLDFNGVPQVHVKNSTSTSSVRTSSELSASDAAEMQVTVPSMIWQDRLRTDGEGGNIYTVALSADQAYTFEFSVNFTEGLGGVLPNISLYDTSNQEIENVIIAAYPFEDPSIICYTITPTVSGIYTVKICNGETYSGVYLSDDSSVATFTPEERGGVLFIYKERFKDDNKTETGYYTRFKFTDGTATTDCINISDIIELRKFFYQDNPTYFDEVYGQDLPDDNYGEGNSFTISGDVAGSDYAHLMEHVLANVGIMNDYIDLEEYLTADELASLDNYLTTISADEETWSDDLDAFVELLLSGDLDKDGNLATKMRSRKIVGSSAVSTSDLDSEYASIPSEITGIPYEERYHMGRGAMAHTFLDPPGGVTINLTETFEKHNEKLQKFKKATENDLMASNDKQPKDNDSEDDHPIATEFYAKFINTASQSESLSKTSANVSLATSALGISAGTGSTSNFKFGLTSTTLVIHYEETEVGYRTLTNKELNKAWEEAELFDIINEDYKRTGIDFVKDFRNDFGDYYVSGYQYGACFDAYIAITTQTSEQLKEVESKLGASLTLSSVSASADITNTTKDTLNKNKATVSVKIVTRGMGKTPVEPKNMQEIPAASKDINAIDDVFGQLLEFRNKLGKNTKRSQYAPVRVKMTRWRSNPKVARRMRKKGDTTGNIPLTVGQTIRIAGFNTDLRDLRAYRNVVGDNADIDGNATRNIEKEFNEVMTLVHSSGERLYGTSAEANASFDQTVKQVGTLIQEFKKLADRYTFYTKLKIAQQQEKETYERLETAAKGAEEGSETAYNNIRQMPFGAEHGGSSGYKEYGVSEYVTADINKGKNDYKAVHISRSKGAAWRIEWTHHETQSDSNLLSYIRDVKPAKLTASTKDGSNAVFCYVKARSSNADSKDDRARWLVDGSPAVGTREVNFYFKSGYSSSIDWELEGQAMSMPTADYPFTGLIAR